MRGARRTHLGSSGAPVVGGAATLALMALGLLGADRPVDPPRVAEEPELGLRVTRPADWTFIAMKDAETARAAILESTKGSSVAATALVGSRTLVQMTAPARDEAGPVPGVSVSIENLLASPLATDPREYAKYSITSLKLIYDDIQWLDFLEPARIGELPAFRNRFNAHVPPQLYEGSVTVEQIFTIQGHIGVCVTLQCRTEEWGAAEAAFRSIVDSMVLPATPPAGSR